MRAKAQVLLEGVEHLDRGLKAQLPRHNLSVTGRLGHNGAHQVIAQPAPKNDFLRETVRRAVDDRQMPPGISLTKSLPKQSLDFIYRNTGHLHE